MRRSTSRRDGKPSDVDGFFPRSMRAPELQRFAQPGDANDAEEDVRFLASLAEQLGQKAQPEGRAPTGTPPEEPEDELAAFHEARLVPQRRAIPAPLRVEDVAMTELIDELETTAAALRLRKAA
ncbi:MAG: hypothetical protein WEC75_12145 [Dehalococcoidia bacterium]